MVALANPVTVAPDVIDFPRLARWMIRKGVIPTCILNNDKSPDTYPWQSETLELALTRPWQRAKAIGYICGILADIDIDDPTSDRPLYAFLAGAGLPRDYRWAIQTPSDGYRVIFQPDDPDYAVAAALHSTAGKINGVPRADGPQDFGHVEYRYRDHQSLIAGQARRKDNPEIIGFYRFIHDKPTEWPQILTPTQILAGFHAIAERPAKKRCARPAGGHVVNSLPTADLNARQRPWIATVYNEELSAVNQSIAHDKTGLGRNDTVNNAAIRWIAYEMQDPRLASIDFLQALHNAAIAKGLDPDDVADTIASARKSADPSEKPLPSWWFETAGQTAPTSTRGETYTAPHSDVSENAPATASAAQLPDSDEKAILYIWKGQGAKVNQAVRAALEYAPNEFISIPDLEKVSGVSSLWRALEEYGGKCLFETKFQNDQDLSYPYPIPTTHDQSEISQPVAEKPATLYRIKPRAERVAIYLDLIGDRLVEKHRLKTGKAIKRHLKALVGDGSDPTLPDDIAPRVWAGMTADERTIENKAIDAAKQEYQQWVQRLEDETASPLPETPNGQTWKTDYRGAIQARASLSALGKQQSWRAVQEQTTFSPATARRIERRIGITRDEVFHPTGQTVQPGETLPDLEYNKRFGGYPATVTALNPDPETGECKTFDYRSKYQRQELAALRHSGEIGAVRVDYQQASIPRLMTDEEKQAYAAHRQQPAKPANTRKQETRPIDAPHIGPGIDPAVAHKWLNWAEMACKLPIATGLSLHERILRVAGRTPIPSDTDWCAALPGSEIMQPQKPRPPLPGCDLVNGVNVRRETPAEVKARADRLFASMQARAERERKARPVAENAGLLPGVAA